METDEVAGRRRIAWLNNYGRVQLRDLLGLTVWQVERLTRFPAPDLPAGRWSTAAAKRLYRRRESLRRQAGTVPDVGVFRAAEYLAEKFGIEGLEPDVIPELVRGGYLAWAGSYKKNRLVSGLDLERFADRAVLERAAVDGRLVKAEQAEAILQVRPVDFGYLVSAGRLKPADHYRGQWSSWVPLYRSGDLQDLLADDSYDWPTVQAVRAGRRSPFAALTPRRSG